MAISFGFFNSENGDRRYTAANIGDYLQGLISSGVYAEKGDSLWVEASGGMTVTVHPGRAMLNFKYMNLDSPLQLTLAAGGAQDRVDAIVAYMDLTERACGITVKQGAQAASPEAPAMERGSTRNEYMLAKVRVKRLSSAITQSSITDTRADTTVCGWVTGLIEQVDTAALFLQWQTAYEEEFAKTQDYLAAQQAAWEIFFNSVTQDNVLPAPALAQVGHFVTVNKTGDGYELTPPSETDKTLSQENQAADAAATSQAIRKAAPINLLDNSDFSNPVNQRDIDSISNPTAHRYLVDRWMIYGNAGTYSVEDDGIEIDNYGGSTCGIYQRVEASRLKAGKMYTLAAKVFSYEEYDGDEIALSYSVAGSAAGEHIAGTKWVKLVDGDMIAVFSFTLNESTDGLYNFRIRTAEENRLFRIRWVALYEGEYTENNLPEYQPKGYAAELLECRRYYQRVNSGYIPFGFGWSNNTTPAAIRVTLPCSPMRIQPTVTFGGTLGNVRLQFNQGAVKVTSVDSVHYRPDAEYMAIFMKPDNVYVGPFVAYCISDYEFFELSADL